MLSAEQNDTHCSLKSNFIPVRYSSGYGGVLVGKPRYVRIFRIASREGIHRIEVLSSFPDPELERKGLQ